MMIRDEMTSAGRERASEWGGTNLAGFAMGQSTPGGGEVQERNDPFKGP